MKKKKKKKKKILRVTAWSKWPGMPHIFYSTVNTLKQITEHTLLRTGKRVIVDNFASSLRKLCLREKKNFEILVSEYLE